MCLNPNSFNENYLPSQCDFFRMSSGDQKVNGTTLKFDLKDESLSTEEMTSTGGGNLANDETAEESDTGESFVSLVLTCRAYVSGKIP